MAVTFQGGDKRLFLQDILNISAIYRIIALINERSCSLYLGPSVSIPANQHCSAPKISLRAKFWKLGLRNEATRTSTFAILANGCQTNSKSNCQKTAKKEKRITYRLLGVIGRVCENSGIETSSDSIGACKQDTALVSFEKFIIQKDLPLRVKKLSTTVLHQMLARSLATSVIDRKFSERILKLMRD